MYWGEGDIGVIRRANLDGSGQTTLIRGLANASAPVLDLAGGQMYFTDFSGGHILRANLDGTGLTTLIAGLSHPNQVAVDIAGGKMYWGSNYPDFDIRRINLDGSGKEILVPNAGLISWITLDVADAKVYWTNFDGLLGYIGRSNLDGSGQEILVPNLTNANPTGVSLDVARGKMYWADWGSGDIRRANLDGTGQEILVRGLGGSPSGLALDLGTPGTAVFYAIAAPASVPSGTAFDLKVTAADPYGTIDRNYQGTVTFSTSDTDPGVVLPADYTFTADDAGVHRFSGGVTLSMPGDQTITVTDAASGITRTATITFVAPN
jgi:hypothetical protein